MEVQVFRGADGSTVEFRGNTTGLLGMGKKVLFQVQDVPIQGMTETSTRVFKTGDIEIAIGADFFHIQQGSVKLHIPVSTTNANTTADILRSLVSGNPVEIPESEEDPVNIGGRRVKTFRRTSKTVSKNGRGLTRKSQNQRNRQS
jgi:hypothetical protein